MKNIVKYASILMLSLGSLNLLASKIDIYNESYERLYIALVTTANGSKNRKARMQPGAVYARVSSKALNTLQALDPNKYLELENFQISGYYDRTLWVSTDEASLQKALQEGKVTQNNIIIWESGSSKAVIIRPSGGYAGVGELDLKFENFKVFKPRLKEKVSSNRSLASDDIASLKGPDANKK